MKLFTIKDFISYNNPCFSCGEKIIFTFGEAINPIISNQTCKVQLVTSYSSSLSLSINLKTNKFESSNIDSLKEYIGQKTIRLESKCSKCGSYVKTHKILFNFDKFYINPCLIELEHLRVKNEKLTYTVITNADGSLFQIMDNKTNTYILDIDVNGQCLYLFKIKTKEKLINKLKTYLIFS